MDINTAALYQGRTALGVFCQSMTSIDGAILVSHPFTGGVDIGLMTDGFAIDPSLGELTNIAYTIPLSGYVTITISTPTGTPLFNLVNNQFEAAGTYNLVWNGTDASGKPIAITGNYILQIVLNAGAKTDTRLGNITININ